MNFLEQFRARVQLKTISKLNTPSKNETLLFSVVRNEEKMIPFFLKYYFSKGLDRAFIVVNNSTDGTKNYLLSQKNVTVFESNAKFGKNKERWLNYLLNEYGAGHWCVVADADEFLYYPNCNKLGIKEICNYLENEGANTLHSILLDFYSKKPLSETKYKVGKNPIEFCNYFDPKSHHSRNVNMGSGVVPKKAFFGGVRERIFEIENLCLSKVPLFKFNKEMRLLDGHHFIKNGKLSKMQGVVMHFKFFDNFYQKAEEESKREEHWENAKEYKKYLEKLGKDGLIEFFCKKSVKFTGKKQLEKLRLLKNPRDFIKKEKK